MKEISVKKFKHSKQQPTPMNDQLQHVTSLTSNATVSNKSVSKFPIVVIGVSYTNRDLPDAYKYSYIALCFLVALVSTLGNVVVSLTIIRVRKLHNATNLLLLSLVTADLLTVLLYVPLYLERFVHQGMENSEPNVCLARKYMYFVTTSGSLVSLAVVCLDRLVAISNPFFHERYKSRKVAIYIILAVWTWTLGYNGFVFYEHKDWDRILASCIAGIPTIVYLVVTIPCFYLPGLVILVVYVRIYFIACNQIKKIQKETIGYPNRDNETQSCQIGPRTRKLVQTYDSPIVELSLSNLKQHSSSLSTPEASPNIRRVRSTATLMSVSASPILGRLRSRSATLLNNALHQSKEKIIRMKRNFHRDLRPLKTVAIMTGVVLLCWLPTAMLYLYVKITNWKLTGKDNQLCLYLAEVFMFISILNSAINPYVYTFRNKDLKHAVRETVTKVLKRWNRNNSFY